MAKKKVSQGSSKGFFSFKWGTGKGKDAGLNYLTVVKVFAIAVVLAGIGLGFYFLEVYVKSASNIQIKARQLVLYPPDWASKELQDRITKAASRNDEDFTIDNDLAMSIARNLQDVSWIFNTRIEIKGEVIHVTSQWRKPVAIYRAGEKQVYVASDLTILDFVPLIGLALPEIKGVGASAPEPGETWNRDEVSAAVELIKLLEQMDDKISKEKPLLYQVAGIDVGNYNNRKARDVPQIVLYAQDGTNINWGAPIGHAAKYFEAPDMEKLAMLYDFYKQHGKLRDTNVKYVELRNPQQHVNMP